MSDQFTALAVTMAARNNFCCGLLIKSDLDVASVSDMRVWSDRSPSNCLGSFSMSFSRLIDKPEIAFKVLPAGEKSVHTGGTWC